MAKVKMRFVWGVGGGFYAVHGVNETGVTREIMDAVRADVREELAALQGHYAAAAESDPNGELGAPIVVADFPADDDPRWAKIDEFGWEAARAQWNLHLEHLAAANHSPDVATKRAYHEAHVKAMRVHMMCRLRHPEWFVVDESQLSAPSATA